MNENEHIDLLTQYGFEYQYINPSNKSKIFSKKRTKHLKYYASIFSKSVVFKLKGEVETPNGMRKITLVKKIDSKRLNEPMLERVMGMLRKTQRQMEGGL